MESLRKSLTLKTLVTHNERVISPMNKEQAMDVRDAFIKVIKCSKCIITLFIHARCPRIYAKNNSFFECWLDFSFMVLTEYLYDKGTNVSHTNKYIVISVIVIEHIFIQAICSGSVLFYFMYWIGKMH